ncbi:aspartic proteinase nepenthesin-1-like [Corylus avellana]|uniref:aspartic proteinase nepenthesin-1-like n=1 Tax=Corylus avellana TaxID=13451 RepID=UPI00286B938E|nr:aspartic proteinase nepenthesin-1-like [Corylus avellana]
MALRSLSAVYWVTLIIHLLIAASGKGFSIKLIPRSSIDTTLFPRNLSLEEHHSRIAQLSRARALQYKYSMNSTLMEKTEQGIETLRPWIVMAWTSLYMAQMFIGSEAYTTYLLVDTGSDDTWIQADGCTICFPLLGGNFNYHESKTYHAVSCDHPLCVPKICHEGLCLYESAYIGGSSTRGIVSADNFTFPANGGFASFQNVVFGCGFDNRNIVFGGNIGPNNVIAGIFGLGSGRRSILRQLGPVTNQRFSYCLPSWTTAQGTYTYLRFGPDAQIRGDAQRIVQTTPMLPGIPRYYVNMLGISIDAVRLPIDPTVFKLNDDGTGGFVLDSGSGQSFLVPGAYNVVKGEMVKNLQRYGWNPIEGEQVPYDICYKVISAVNHTALPSMTFHFMGAELVVDSKAVFQVFDDMFCMAILPIYQQGPNILGAFQQANHRFLFDVRASTMSFVQETCQSN